MHLQISQPLLHLWNYLEKPISRQGEALLMMENICTECFSIRKNIWRMILVHWRKGWSQPTDQVPALIATSVCAWGGAVSGGLTRIISCQCSQPGTLHFGTYSKVRYRPSGNANTCPRSPWSLQGPLSPSTSADQVPSCTCLLNDFSTPSVLASIETSYQSSSRMRLCDLSNRGRKCA
jgi:hypothetical protein